MGFLSRQSTRGLRFAVRQALFLGLLSLLVSPGLAERGAGSPFAALPGAWTGTGTIAMSNGTKERIRCRAAYRLEGGSANLRLELSCTSDSYKFELRSQITYDGGAISGNWDEATRGVGGNITGTATGSQIRARAEGQTFTAILAMDTRGTKQSVSIQSPGSEMSSVTIELARGAR